MVGNVKIYFGLPKIRCSSKLKSKDFLASSVSTYGFSTLYTTLSHNLIKENLLNSLNKCYIKRALFSFAQNEKHIFFFISEQPKG